MQPWPIVGSALSFSIYNSMCMAHESRDNDYPDISSDCDIKSSWHIFGPLLFCTISRVNLFGFWKGCNMNVQRLIKNILDQVKEAQLKLGYEKESLRLYYQASTINALLGTKAYTLDELLKMLSDYSKNNAVTVDSAITVNSFVFGKSRERMEIIVSSDICEYVDKNIEAGDFLKSFIGLLMENHHACIDEICRVFEKYDKKYIRKDMPENSDFDYVLYFSDKSIDEYFYCIKDEGIHCIYHRFIEEDYLALLE